MIITREEKIQMVTAAMQGLISKSECKYGDHAYIAMNAVKFTNELIKELQK